jgi:hypothetical protein
MRIQYIKVVAPGRVFQNKPPKTIVGPDTIDVGYGAGQLRPNGDRQPMVEYNRLGGILMRVNGMSGQLT